MIAFSSSSPSQAKHSEQTPSVSPQEQQQISQLKQRDAEVKAHEAAHLAAAGSLSTGGVQLNYQRGPDGIQYAVSGEVQIDTSKVANDPEATLKKAQQIQTAALAPAQPSVQDRQVAAKAAQMAIEARAEINAQQNRSEQNKTNSDLNSFLIDTPSKTESIIDHII